MQNIKTELSKMLNRALELEHSARIQYLAHAELIKGLGAEAVVARLKEIASDEQEQVAELSTLPGISSKKEVSYYEM